MKATLSLYGDLSQIVRIKNKKDSKKLMRILKKYHVTNLKRNLNYKELLEKFLQDKSAEGNVRSICRSREKAVNKFMKYSKKKLEEINKEDVLRYMEYLKKKDLKSGSIYIILSHLRNFFVWLSSEGYLEDDPTKGIKYKMKSQPRRAIPPEDVEKIRKACKTLTEKTLIEFFINTGCRLSEVSNVKVEDINFKNNSVTVFGKGSKTRTVLFDENTKKLMKRLIKESGDGSFLFCKVIKRKHTKYTKNQITDIIKDVASRTDIKYSIHPHLFRHTFATNCLAKGMDLVSIQKLLGHSDISTTQVYAESSLENIQKEYNSIFK